ncbi:MAG: hypothetical protein H6860_06480 [Rhodospirillales bacterium]|nr:hypothetical protein [Alphaproteobacteria bacterium]MCB9982026.1 hypothetical protein [Rhodospirillales bacterium]
MQRLDSNHNLMADPDVQYFLTCIAGAPQPGPTIERAKHSDANPSPNFDAKDCVMLENTMTLGIQPSTPGPEL